MTMREDSVPHLALLGLCMLAISRHGLSEVVVKRAFSMLCYEDTKLVEEITERLASMQYDVIVDMPGVEDTVKDMKLDLPMLMVTIIVSV